MAWTFNKICLFITLCTFIFLVWLCSFSQQFSRLSSLIMLFAFSSAFQVVSTPVIIIYKNKLKWKWKGKSALICHIKCTWKTNRSHRLWSACEKNALNVLLNGSQNYQSLFGTFACNHTNTKCQIIKKELNLRCGAMLIHESIKASKMDAGMRIFKDIWEPSIRKP